MWSPDTLEDFFVVFDVVSTDRLHGRVGTEGVNRSFKISDLRKSPSPFRTSVGQPIFSWTFLGQAISYSKAHSFIDLIGLWTIIQ